MAQWSRWLQRLVRRIGAQTHFDCGCVFSAGAYYPERALNQATSQRLLESCKEHRRVEEQGRKEQEQEASASQLKSTVAKQETIIAQEQAEIKALTASVKEQAAQIQKVSDRLELSKPAPQMVADNQ